METFAAAAPAGNFFPSFILLVCGTLVAAVLGAAHRLGLFNRLMYKVDKESIRHGGENVAVVLRAHGVRFLFTLVGGHISPVLVACEKLGIRVVDTRHEVTAVFAADAVARLTGTVGVAAVTAGPGLTNTVTAVKNAQIAQSPVLLLGGAASTLLQNRGALQAIDQMSLFRPLCKFCASVRRVRDIMPTLRTAMAFAQSGTPGPVFVELPIDVLYPYFMVQKEMVPAKPPKGLMGRVVSWYLENHLANLFAGAWEPQPEGPLPLDIPQAPPQQVQRCVEILSRARRPLVLLGSQALLPPTPADKLRVALETLGVPCFLGGMARGLLGRNHPLHIRQNRSAALKKADVVLLAGIVCDFRLSYGRVLSRSSKIIIVNRDRKEMLINSDMFWKPQEAVQGKSALHWAAAVNNVEATLALLKNGANKDMQDSKEETPLFLAAREGSYEAAKLLLDHFANREITDHLDRLPRDVAQERLHQDIVRLLDQPSGPRSPPGPHGLGTLLCPPGAFLPGLKVAQSGGKKSRRLPGKAGLGPQGTRGRGKKLTLACPGPLAESSVTLSPVDSLDSPRPFGGPPASPGGFSLEGPYVGAAATAVSLAQLGGTGRAGLGRQPPGGCVLSLGLLNPVAVPLDWARLPPPAPPGPSFLLPLAPGPQLLNAGTPVSPQERPSPYMAAPGHGEEYPVPGAHGSPSKARFLRVPSEHPYLTPSPESPEHWASPSPPSLSDWSDSTPSPVTATGAAATAAGTLPAQPLSLAVPGPLVQAQTQLGPQPEVTPKRQVLA